MGYEMNSPVKQVWLPLDYDFLMNNNSLYFDEFAKRYKAKYGIELHDIFKLNVDDEQKFDVGTKVDIVSAYNVGKLDGVLDSKMAVFNAIYHITVQKQGESATAILLVSVSTRDNDASGHGFQFVLPELTEREVHTIDDLKINAYEI